MPLRHCTSKNARDTKDHVHFTNQVKTATICQQETVLLQLLKAEITNANDSHYNMKRQKNLRWSSAVFSASPIHSAAKKMIGAESQKNIPRICARKYEK